jgi:hypothetical protein
MVYAEVSAVGAPQEEHDWLCQSRAAAAGCRPAPAPTSALALALGPAGPATDSAPKRGGQREVVVRIHIPARWLANRRSCIVCTVSNHVRVSIEGSGCRESGLRI